ncbi:MAG: hemolysin family protein [Phycisphaerae bacterium]|nr:hemolysin family protein [Phycisphaerae bacterium]
MPYSLADLPLFLALPILLATSAFFSGSETALFGLSAHQRFRLTDAGTLVGRCLIRLLSDQRTLLVTLMMGNMTVNVLYFVICSALLLQLDPTSVHPLLIALGTVAPLLAIIIFGEVLPKLVANLSPGSWVGVAAVPLDAIHRTTRPLGRILGLWVIRPLGRLIAPRPAIGRLSATELRTLLEMSEARGVIGADEQHLLQSVLKLGDLKVRDIMVPQVDLATIDCNDSPEKIQEHIRRHHVNRHLVIDGDIDHVVGVLYTRQFLLAARQAPAPKLDRLVRQVRYVPELQRVDRLLEDFRKTGTKLAVVVDEYGGTAGLVTLKEVVKQMVGELDLDHPDTAQASPPIERVADGVWQISGRLSIHDWAQAFAAENMPRRIATVGGLITARLGRVPQEGDRVQLANLELRVEKVVGGRVESVRLQLIPDSPPAEGEGP